MLVAERDPPPEATAQSTDTAETTFPLESLTTAVKGLERAEPAVPVWLLPEETANWLAVPAVPVAVDVTDVAVPWIVAVAEFEPATIPRVKVEETSPLPLVEVLVAVRDPPPEATAQSTVAPETRFPLESLTMAVKALDRAEPATPDWLLPEERAIVEAAPAAPVAVKVTEVAVP